MLRSRPWVGDQGDTESRRRVSKFFTLPADASAKGSLNALFFMLRHESARFLQKLSQVAAGGRIDKVRPPDGPDPPVKLWTGGRSGPSKKHRDISALRRTFAALALTAASLSAPSASASVIVLDSEWGSASYQSGSASAQNFITGDERPRRVRHQFRRFLQRERAGDLPQL